MKKKPITAEALMARLEADPVFVAARTKREEERERAVNATRAALAPLLSDLRAHGFPFAAIDALVEQPNLDPRAVSVLLDHLTRPYPNDARRVIAQALCVPGARSCWGDLVAAYRKEADPFTKELLANAVSSASSDAVLTEVIDLLFDQGNGDSRNLLLVVLEKRAADPTIPDVLSKLATDPVLEKEVAAVMRRLESRKRRREARRKS